MNILREILDLIWQNYSGEAAWQTVSDLSRFHRIQASPGYRRAAQLIRQRLIRDGLDAEILSYRADEQTRFWAWRSFQEWTCTEAKLRLVAPVSEARELADFRACPISVIQRSAPFEGEVEVALLEDGEEQADYSNLDVAGKVVLSQGDLRRVWKLAVEQRGAVGILSDAMRVINPVRPVGALSDIRQYTSFWWQPGDTKSFGFVLTPRQGQNLRRLLAEAKEPVCVRASVESRLYDGALEVVSAAIPGETREEIIIIAHLCHPQPSANDNASGAAAALEAARALQSLIVSGRLPRPKRTIRFLWTPEMTGTFAYLSSREAELDRLLAGINLDMVGEDQGQTGSSWLIEWPPDAAASFAPDLLARLRDELPALKDMVDVSAGYTELGAYPLFRQAEVAFSGGSDHFVLSDPSVGVPTPMLIQWPDRFYHTAADTPDRSDPHSLARAGSLAAAYACWLAMAGAREVTWLGYEMIARFKARLIKTAQAEVTDVLALRDGEALSRAQAKLDRRLAYLLDRQKAALSTLEQLAPVECPLNDLLAEAERTANQELAWAKGVVELHAAARDLVVLMTPPSQDLSHEEQQAASLTPVRQVRGPVPLLEHMRDLDDRSCEAWRQLLKARKGRLHHTLTTLALYWADGNRSVLEIIDLVELETGQRDVELLLTYFRLLERLEFVAFQ